MRVDDALRQIEAIHEHLDKGEVYHGFQVGGVLASGVVGLIAAAVQDRVVAPGHFVVYWVGMAAACGLIAGGSAVYAFAYRENAMLRRKTLRMLGQFAPCLVAGLAVTWAFSDADLHRYLPGLWALLFGFGILAARPYLPRATGWVCLYFLAAGCVLLIRSPLNPEPTGWRVGGVFGLGQLAAAAVLSRNKERDDYVPNDSQ